MESSTDKRSKILNVVFFILIFVSILVAFYRYMILKDFVILTDEEAFNESLMEE